MTVSTRINSANGLVSTDGSTGVTVEKNASNRGFGPYPVDSVLSASTNNATLDVSNAGLTPISSSAGAITLVMPLASATAGAKFIFRTLSADAHILTGSAEAAGTRVFVDGQGTSATAIGSRLTFPAVAGSTVILESDGAKYLIVAKSGSFTQAGT